MSETSKNDTEEMTGQYNKYVTKYKRTKNLVKKCAEISRQSQIDIVLILFDRCSKRMREYHTSDEMSLPKIQETIQTKEFRANYKHERYLTKLSGKNRDLDIIEQDILVNHDSFRTTINNHENRIRDLKNKIKELTQK